MLTIEKLSKQYATQRIFENADLFIGPYDRAGLVGPNGTGKTTLFRLITGTETPDGGSIHLDAHKTVGILSQESQCTLGITVREEMQSAFPEADEAEQKIAALAGQLISSTNTRAAIILACGATTAAWLVTVTRATTLQSRPPEERRDPGDRS